MDNLLQQIRGVVGVSGALVYDRRKEESSVILPASFDDSFAESIKQKFLDIMEFVSDSAMFRIKLARGWAIIKISRHYGFLVLAKPDLNVSTLNLVLKSIAVALDQASNANEKKRKVYFNKDSVFTLLRALNLVGDYFSDKLSRFQIADLLRQCKTTLVEYYPDLKHFAVDHNGTVSLIKGSEVQLDKTITDAIAKWIGLFKVKVGEKTVVAGFNMKDVTKVIRPDLESMNFYQTLRKFA
jgi:hypothetical protein